MERAESMKKELIEKITQKIIDVEIDIITFETSLKAAKEFKIELERQLKDLQNV